MFIKSAKKDWGNGIPIYNKTDLMTKEELYDFALDVVCNHESKTNKIISINPNYDSYPSVVMEIDGKLSFILVESDIAPLTPKITYQRKYNFIKHASRFDAKTYYASVVFGSCDPNRFDASIALKGDRFYAKYLGLELIEGFEKIPSKNSSEYKLYVTTLFAICYEKRNFDNIYKFIDDNCKWFSFFSGNTFNSKKEIVHYYLDKQKHIQNTKIISFLIRFTNDYFKIKNKDNSIIMIPQPNNEVGILFEQEINGNKNGLILAIKFNHEGLINDIYLGDPHLMKFNILK